MNRNEEKEVQKIRARYTEKERSALDELRELDAKVKRPANIFSYVFGSISAIIMGAGMSLVMTDIGATIGMNETMIPGIIIGMVGMVMALVNYPIHTAIMNARKKKYAPEIIAMSDQMINQ